MNWFPFQKQINHYQNSMKVAFTSWVFYMINHLTELSVLSNLILSHDSRLLYDVFRHNLWLKFCILLHFIKLVKNKTLSVNCNQKEKIWLTNFVPKQHKYLPNHKLFSTGFPLLRYISWSDIEIVLISVFPVLKPAKETTMISCW